MRAHPLVHEFPNKAFVVSVEDSPLGFLPGLYASLSRHRYHPNRHRTWIFRRTENPYIYLPQESWRAASPTRLASFTGAESHAIRAQLFEMQASLARQNISVAATKRGQFASNPNDPQLKLSQLNFIDAILDAKFNLCPRGNGAGTYRLQESLALGRAPVIISDAWVPVAGLDWEQFAVFVPEQALPDLASILRQYEPRWKEMGDRALETYKSFFRPETYAAQALGHIADIYRERTHDERHFMSQWQQMIEAEKRRTDR